MVFDDEVLESLANSLDDESTIAHRSVKILTLLALGGDPDPFEFALNKFGWHYWHYPNEFNPLIYALETQNRELLNVFSRYFKEVDSIGLNKDILLKGMACNSRDFRQFIISRFMSEGRSISDMPPKLPETKDPFVLSFLTKEFTKDNKMLKEISAFNERYSTYEPCDIKYLTTSIKGDYTLASRLVSSILKVMKFSGEEVVTSDMKGLVYTLWYQNRPLIMVNSFLYWIFTALVFFNLVLCRTGDECRDFIYDSIIIYIVWIYLRIMMTLLWLFLVVYEIVIVRRKRFSHLKNFENKLDLVIYIGYLPVLIFSLIGTNWDSYRVPNFVIAIYLLLLATRSLLHLKVFDGMRYLLNILTQVIKDLKNYFVILGIAILFFAAIKV